MCLANNSEKRYFPDACTRSLIWVAGGLFLDCRKFNLSSPFAIALSGCGEIVGFSKKLVWPIQRDRSNSRFVCGRFLWKDHWYARYSVNAHGIVYEATYFRYVLSMLYWYCSHISTEVKKENWKPKIPLMHAHTIKKKLKPALWIYWIRKTIVFFQFYLYITK